MVPIRLKTLINNCRDGACLRSSNLLLVASQARNQESKRQSEYTDRDHLLSAAAWLKWAQDVAGDGGVCRCYHLRKVWTSSYPETSGYIIPTFPAPATGELQDDEFRVRARRAVEFLLPLQMSDRAFLGGEVAENQPQTFVVQRRADHVCDFVDPGNNALRIDCVSLEHDVARILGRLKEPLVPQPALFDEHRPPAIRARWLAIEPLVLDDCAAAAAAAGGIGYDTSQWRSYRWPGRTPLSRARPVAERLKARLLSPITGRVGGSE